MSVFILHVGVLLRFHTLIVCNGAFGQTLSSSLIICLSPPGSVWGALEVVWTLDLKLVPQFKYGFFIPVRGALRYGDLPLNL